MSESQLIIDWMGKLDNRLDRIENGMSDLRVSGQKNSSDIEKVENKVKELELRAERIESKIEILETKSNKTIPLKEEAYNIFFKSSIATISVIVCTVLAYGILNSLGLNIVTIIKGLF